MTLLASVLLMRWLKAHKQGLYTVVDVCRRHVTDGSGRMEETHEFAGWSVASAEQESPTVRDAIDAAMAKRSAG